MSDASVESITEIDTDDPDPDAIPTDTLEAALAVDDDSTRIHAARLAATVSTEDASVLEPVVPTLAEALADETSVVAYQSLIALTNLARESPEAVEPAVPGLVDLLNHDLPLLQSVAARALGHVATDRPDLLAGQVSALLAATDQPDATVLEPEEVTHEMIRLERTQHRDVNREATTQREIARETAPNLLVEIAEDDPTAVTPHAEAVVDLLSDRNAGVVAAAADVVATLASSDLADDEVDATLQSAVDPLVEQLDHFDDSVVANVVAALGYLEARRASDAVETVAEDEERPEELRELAADTAAYLANDD